MTLLHCRQIAPSASLRDVDIRQPLSFAGAEPSVRVPQPALELRDTSNDLGVAEQVIGAMTRGRHFRAWSPPIGKSGADPSRGDFRSY